MKKLTYLIAMGLCVCSLILPTVASAAKGKIISEKEESIKTIVKKIRETCTIARPGSIDLLLPTTKLLGPVLEYSKDTLEKMNPLFKLSGTTKNASIPLPDLEKINLFLDSYIGIVKEELNGFVEEKKSCTTLLNQYHKLVPDVKKL